MLARPTDRTLGVALAVMRLTVAAFFLVWSIEKIVLPEKQQGVFDAFYFSVPPIPVIVGLGIVQTTVIALFALGLFRFWTYGALLLMHAASTLSTAARLADPYEGVNHLFWAAVPVLGLLVALFMLREHDTRLSLARHGRETLR